MVGDDSIGTGGAEEKIFLRRGTLRLLGRLSGDVRSLPAILNLLDGAAVLVPANQPALSLAPVLPRWVT